MIFSICRSTNSNLHLAFHWNPAVLLDQKKEGELVLEVSWADVGSCWSLTWGLARKKERWKEENLQLSKWTWFAVIRQLHKVRECNSLFNITMIISFCLAVSLLRKLCWVCHMMMITSCNLFTKKKISFWGSLVLITVIKYTHLLVSPQFEAKQFCPVARMGATESRGKYLLWLNETKVLDFVLY